MPNSNSTLRRFFRNLQSAIRNRKTAAPRRPLFETLENRSLLSGFQFADFSDSTELQLVGSASVNANHELRLTPVSPLIPGVPIHAVVGGAWYVAEKSPVAAGFSTTFQFRATNTDTSRIPWGFAFIIQNSNPYELRDGGSGLGYASSMPDGL